MDNSRHTTLYSWKLLLISDRGAHWRTRKESFRRIYHPSISSIKVKPCPSRHLFRQFTPRLTSQGHSMTIIGFEIRDNGHANLLVFDPMFKTSPAMQRLIGTSAQSNNPSRLLKAYRRGAPYLQKYKIFELLKWAFRPGCQFEVSRWRWKKKRILPDRLRSTDAISRVNS